MPLDLLRLAFEVQNGPTRPLVRSCARVRETEVKYAPRRVLTEFGSRTRTQL